VVFEKKGFRKFSVVGVEVWVRGICSRGSVFFFFFFLVFHHGVSEAGFSLVLVSKFGGLWGDGVCGILLAPTS